MKTRKILTIIAVSITFSLIYFNTAIVAIAFSSITESLVSHKFSEQWIINSYILSIVTFSLIIGKLCDLYKSRNLTIFGLIIFSIGSLGCYLSNNFNLFILFRVLQGLGSSCMITPATKLLAEVFSSRQFGKAIGLTTGFATIGMMMSPILGGITIQHFGWRWIFIINIILSFISAIILINIKTKKIKSFDNIKLYDVISFILIAVSLFSFVFAIMEGPSFHWLSSTIITLFSISIISFILLVFIESNKKQSLFQIKKVANFNFITSNIIIIFTEAFSISLIFLIMYMQKTLTYPPMSIGFLILPFYILVSISSFSSGYLINKYGPFKPLIIAIIIILISYNTSYFLLPNQDYYSILPVIIGLGVGLETLINASKTIVIQATEKKYKGLAIGIQSNSRELSATISFAIFASITSYYKYNAHLSLNTKMYDAFFIIISICSILALLILLLSILLNKKNKN